MDETMIESLQIVAPALSLTFFAIFLFALDAVPPRSGEVESRIGFWTALVGLGVSAVLIPHVPGQGILNADAMLRWDGLSYVVSWITVLAVFLVIVVSPSYKPFKTLRLNAYYGLLLLAAAGLVLLSASND